MILLDYNAIAVGNLVTQKLDVQEDLIRHMILNTIRMYNLKYRKKYGQMVVCCDSSSWRREVFPQYKHKRRANRQESDFDWSAAFDIINKVREEIRENLPYVVLHINRCEADDIIATLVELTQDFGKHDDVMIISGDKDFAQLQKYKNVEQYSPLTKKMITIDNPKTHLFEHILKGDSSDGVPNVLSPDNTFVDGIRQSPVTKKKIETWVEISEDLATRMDPEIYRNYCRNKKLIDLSEVPEDLKETIINSYESAKPASKLKVLNYLVKKRCKMLIESVEEFY